jgi:starch-binding outer membrane protein, SusD/RagB family
MRTIKQYILYILFISLATTGCQKEFLELAPEAQTNAGNFYRTQSDFNTAVVGAYASFQDYPNMYFELSSYRSDELTIGAPTAGAQDRYNIDHFSDDPSNQLLLTSWGSLYNGIARCNEITSRIGAASFADNLKRQYESEARFIRAYHYYNLVNLWGAVPLVLEPLSASQALATGKSSVPDVYKAIEADLDFAMQNLPPAFTGNDLGRATSGAARTLLAKAQLQQKKYQDVVTTLQPVLNGPYQLLTDVSQVFNVNNKVNAEIVFAVRYNKELVGQGHALWQSTTAATSSLVPATILNSYSANDQRLNLLRYNRSGTSNTFVPNKFMDVVSVTTRNAGNDFTLLRYPDILLMYAEARNELGYGNAEALTSLNKVHTRPGNAAYLITDLPDQSSFRNAVFLERKLEFPYEGGRWFDLLRAGTYATQMKTAENLNVANFRVLYPIPQSEIEKLNNPSIFPQNTGY